MSNQSRTSYWNRSRPGERDALRRNLHDRGFACAAERFATRRLGLIPEPMWEAPFDALGRPGADGSKGRLKFEIKSRRHDDRRAFSDLNPSGFDVLVVCLWKIVPLGSRRALKMECRTVRACNLPAGRSPRLNSLLRTAHVAARGVAPV